MPSFSWPLPFHHLSIRDDGELRCFLAGTIFEHYPIACIDLVLEASSGPFILRVNDEQTRRRFGEVGKSELSQVKNTSHLRRNGVPRNFGLRFVDNRVPYVDPSFFLSLRLNLFTIHSLLVSLSFSLTSSQERHSSFIIRRIVADRYLLFFARLPSLLGSETHGHLARLSLYARSGTSHDLLARVFNKTNDTSGTK